MRSITTARGGFIHPVAQFINTKGWRGKAAWDFMELKGMCGKVPWGLKHNAAVMGKNLLNGFGIEQLDQIWTSTHCQTRFLDRFFSHLGTWKWFIFSKALTPRQLLLWHTSGQCLSMTKMLNPLANVATNTHSSSSWLCWWRPQEQRFAEMFSRCIAWCCPVSHFRSQYPSLWSLFSSFTITQLTSSFSHCHSAHPFIMCCNSSSLQSHFPSPTVPPTWSCKLLHWMLWWTSKRPSAVSHRRSY